VVSQRLTMVMAAEHRDALAPVVAAITEGTITPAVSSVYSLDSVAEAMTDLVGGRVRGAAVLRIGDGS